MDKCKVIAVASREGMAAAAYGALVEEVTDIEQRN